MRFDPEQPILHSRNLSGGEQEELTRQILHDLDREVPNAETC